MVVPVSGHIPDSTLSPFQVRQKFASQSLAGLGCDASCDFDATGNCSDCGDGGITTGTTTTIGTDGGFYGTFTPPAPNPSGSLYGTTVTDTYMSAGGNIITVFSDGTFRMVGSTTGAVSMGQGTLPPAAQGTVSAAQASAWPSIINALSRAGVQLGSVAMLQPGQTLLPNGTILGSGQSLIGRGGTGINATMASFLNNPVLLIGGFGLIALLALSGGRR